MDDVVVINLLSQTILTPLLVTVALITAFAVIVTLVMIIVELFNPLF